MSTIDCSVGGNDDTNWFLAPNPISAVIMEGTAAGALLFLLIGFIFTSGLIDQELRHFKISQAPISLDLSSVFCSPTARCLFSARLVAVCRARCELPARQLCSPQRD